MKIEGREILPLLVPEANHRVSEGTRSRASLGFSSLLGFPASWPISSPGSPTFRFSTLCAAIALLLITAATARAGVYEWNLVERGLERRTTTALTRYYTEVKPQSLWVRYIGQNAGRINYRLRGARTQADTIGQLLSISLGQFRIFSTSEIRIALGDDLYGELILSRNNPLAGAESVYTGDSFSHDDWSGNHTIFISPLERIDYRINPTLGGFVALGAPESNLSWWNDGTLRLGLATPQWEFAMLAPFGAGAIAVGPYRERLLAPGFGAAALVRLLGFTGRARFTVLSETAFRSPVVAPATYIHTLSLQGTYQWGRETGIGNMRLSVGAGYEEFAEVCRNLQGEPVQGERIRRASPVADLFWVAPNENIQFGLGLADIALRGSATVRLTNNLWFEVRAVSNDIFRKLQPFEHPFLLFLTPRLKF